MLADACRSDNTQMEDWIISGEYNFVDTTKPMPIIISDVKRLCSPKELDSRIRALSTVEIELMDCGEELAQRTAELDTLKQEEAALRQELEDIQAEKAEEEHKLRVVMRTTESFQETAYSLSRKMNALGFAVDLSASKAPASGETAPAGDYSVFWEQTQNRLSQNYNLYYEDCVIREFLGGDVLQPDHYSLRASRDRQIQPVARHRQVYRRGVLSGIRAAQLDR